CEGGRSGLRRGDGRRPGFRRAARGRQLRHFASGGYTEISTRRLSAWFIGSSGLAGSSQPLPSTVNLLGSKLYFLTSACFTASARSFESAFTSSKRVPLPFIDESVWPTTATTPRSYWPTSRATFSSVAATLGS